VQPTPLPAHPNQRIPALDGVRGLALLTVLVFHTLPVTDHVSPVTTIWNALAKSCWVGVDLFFVLSGFLITRVLCESRSSPRYFANFYLRRALRIGPLYFAVLLGAIYLIPAFIPAAQLPPLFPRLIENRFWVFTFLQNFIQARSPHQLPGFGHFWTLAIEEQFYLIWPVIVFYFSRRNLMLLCLAICLLEPLARFLCLHLGYSTWAVRQLTYLRLDTLLFGALLYLLMTETKFHNLLSPRALAASLAGLSLAALIALSCILFKNSFLPYESVSTGILGYSAVAILAAALLYIAIHNRFHARQFFSAPALRWFGKYSYGIYVFSVPCILCFEALIAPRDLIPNPYLLPIARFLCCGIASTALAVVSWHVLESPFLRLKSQFFPARTSPALAVVVTSFK
jgi:peptidoglycan/LPS O-acetylase OafA/YrhL